MNLYYCNIISICFHFTSYYTGKCFLIARALWRCVIIYHNIILEGNHWINLSDTQVLLKWYSSTTQVILKYFMAHSDHEHWESSKRNSPISFCPHSFVTTWHCGHMVTPLSVPPLLMRAQHSTAWLQSFYIEVFQWKIFYKNLLVNTVKKNRFQWECLCSLIHILQSICTC